MKSRWRCGACGSANVEVCLPAWFNPNKGFKFVEADEAADELSVFCNDCEDPEYLVNPNGQHVSGRW